MAGFFGFMAFLVLVIIILTNKVTRKAFDVAEHTLNSTLNVIDGNLPKVEHLIDKGLSSVIISSDGAFADMLQERFEKNNIDDNFIEAVNLHQKICVGLDLMRK